MFENFAVYLTKAIEDKLKQKQLPVSVLEIEEALFSMEFSDQKNGSSW
jgi:hypothetical protein